MRSDSQALGFITGVLAPVMGFFLYGVIYVTDIRPYLELKEFVQDIFLGTRLYQSPILSLALIANLPLFFFYDHRDMHKAMRGVIMASFLYGIVIVVLWFL
ncbi:MAG: hypothetical protein IPL52_03460 [Flavobacteriales bacterium]|nr:hypothetical protein [Flavobacteriales bacterium]